MGWKDIFGRRRMPEERLPKTAAMLRQDGPDMARIAEAAVACMLKQLAPDDPLYKNEDVRRLAAGYLIGQAAVRCSLPLGDVLNAFAEALPDDLLFDFSAPGTAAGRLIGEQEAKCGTSRLFAAALDCLSGRISPEALLTACDNAADRQQTHAPAKNFRFTPIERRLLLEGIRKRETLA